MYNSLVENREFLLWIEESKLEGFADDLLKYVEKEWTKDV